MIEIWGAHHIRKDLGKKGRIFIVWKKEKRKRIIYAYHPSIYLFIHATSIFGVHDIIGHPCPRLKQRWMWEQVTLLHAIVEVGSSSKKVARSAQIGTGSFPN